MTAIDRFGRRFVTAGPSQKVLAFLRKFFSLPLCGFRLLTPLFLGRLIANHGSLPDDLRAVGLLTVNSVVKSRTEITTKFSMASLQSLLSCARILHSSATVATEYPAATLFCADRLLSNVLRVMSASAS